MKLTRTAKGNIKIVLSQEEAEDIDGILEFYVEQHPEGLYADVAREFLDTEVVYK